MRIKMFYNFVAVKAMESSDHFTFDINSNKRDYYIFLFEDINSMITLLLESGSPS